MLTIQEVGSEILNKQPRSFYIFAGPEYGIKCKYLEILSSLYSETKCIDSVDDVLKLMNTKHLIPLVPTLYVVRYDDSFVKGLSDTTSAKITNTKICGTIVCLYEDNKLINKLNKYLPDFTVDINHVDDKFVFKYLKLDFPNIPDRLIDICVKLGTDYGHSKNIARSMSKCNISELFEMSDNELAELFGANLFVSDKDIRVAFASRQFNRVLKVLNKYEGTADNFMYTLLSTLVELEKLHYNKYCESDIRKYSNLWSLEDTYNMFNQIYDEIDKSRSISSNLMNSIIYVAALTQFSNVPSVEMLC